MSAKTAGKVGLELESYQGKGSWILFVGTCVFVAILMPIVYFVPLPRGLIERKYVALAAIFVAVFLASGFQTLLMWRWHYIKCPKCPGEMAKESSFIKKSYRCKNCGKVVVDHSRMHP